MIRSVLVLDNSPLMFDQYRSCLNSFSCDLSHARSGEEALRLAAQETFDLIFTELELPGMSGYEFKHRLNLVENVKDVPVVSVSAPADDWSLKRMRAAGFFAFFAKPLCQERLLSVISPFLLAEPVYATATGVSR